MAEARKTAKIGNFELLERIGQGGMGTVFKARQLSMDRIVAVKILPPSLAKQGTFTERFVREAKASAKLNHPNIVGGIDVGQDNGVYYFAMEYVNGPSAKDLLAKGKFTEEQVVRIGRAMAEALTHAHTHGILHRDMKPDNILIDKDGTPKLCDLGLARLDSEDESKKHLTQQGQAVGTPHYISPEQARGQRDLDAKTDLYSLGATLYHMLTAKTMFDGATSVVVMSKHISEKCPNPNDAGVRASKGLVAILAKLLTKDREDRYESAEQLAQDLERVARGKPPRFAELAPGKSPFSGGAVPSGPVKKSTAVPAAEKVRAPRRDTRTTDAVKPAKWLMPVGLAGLLLAALVLAIVMGTRPSPTADADASKAPHDKDAVAAAAGVKPAHPPAVAVATLPPKAAPPRVAPQAEALGFKKPSEPILRVPPKAEPIGFAARTEAAPVSPAAGAKTETPPTEPTKAAPKEPAVVKPTGPVDDPSKATPGPELANLISRALLASVKSEFREAADLFKTAKLEKFDSFDRDLAKIHADAYTGLAETKTQILERLKADPNRLDASKVLARAPGGKLVGGDDKNLDIKDKQASFPWPWAKLSMDELHNLTGLALGSVPPNAALGLAVVAYDQNTEPMDAFAKKVLTGTTAGSGRRILDLIDLRDKVVIAKTQAVQTAYAEKLLFEVNEAMADGKFAAVAAKASQLRAKYGDTEAVKSRSAELDGLIEVAQLAVKTGAVPQPGNVALHTNGTLAKGSESAEYLIDGNSTRYTGGSGFATLSIGGEWLVTLPKIYLLREIRMLLWDGDAERFYRYQIEVSHDGEKYTMVADRSKDEWRSWQVIKFAPRPVKSIKIKGLHNSVASAFYVVELEAYCVRPDRPPQSTRGGASAAPPPPRGGPPLPPAKAPPPPPKRGEG